MSRWADIAPGCRRRVSVGRAPPSRDELRAGSPTRWGAAGARAGEDASLGDRVARRPTAGRSGPAGCATQSYEAALVVALNDLAARHVVPLTAVGPRRGLFLTPTSASPLGTAMVDDWCRVVAAGAHLQLEVARYVGRLVDVGLTVLAPADCQATSSTSSTRSPACPRGSPGAAPDRRDVVRAALLQVTGWRRRSMPWACP